MTTKNENQSQNPPTDKIKNETNIIESLAEFQAALVEINTELDKLLHDIKLDSTRLKELRKKLRHHGEIWPLEDAKEHLHLIITLAGFGKPQYLEHNDSVVEVTKVKG